ncbi:MAG: diguanylate cyclase (GGDEF)-like protein [Pseudohongiellaceae bacterium]|jgi:diguanylate cyclase (GGDEF)-like protein
MKLLKVQRPLISAYLSGMVVFFLALIITLVMYTLNDRFQFKLVQKELVDLARIASKYVNTAEHQLLTKPEQTNNDFYRKIITPLVDIHNAVPDILYLYTMREIDKKIYYILDTANDNRLIKKEGLDKSLVMDIYEFDKSEDAFRNWLPTLHVGKIDIDDEFYLENGQYIISASVPIFDQNGGFFGLLGIDFNISLYEKNRQEILKIAFAVIFIALIISILIARKVYSISTKLEKTHAQLYLQAHTDFLTNAYNRRYFIELAEREINRSQRRPHTLSLLMIDIDYFKIINDKYGHLTGDKVLILLVKTIKKTMRKNDILARFGGEEFIMLLPDTELEKSVIFTKRLQKELSLLKVKSLEGESFNITVSIGISQFESKLDFDSWLNQADDAMYKAKESGRDQFKCYSLLE